MIPQQSKFIEKMYREQYSKLLRYTESSLTDSAWAQDVVHDTFYEALKQADKLAGHENPDGWLMQTLKNKISDRRRKHLRYIRRFLSLDSDLGEAASVCKPDEDAGSVSEILNKIRDTLTEAEFYLLKRLVLEQASHAEVAQELGISVWACQKRLERIRKKLYAVFPERQKKKTRTGKICCF